MPHSGYKKSMKIVLRGLVNFFGRKWKQNKERKLLSVFLVEKKKRIAESLVGGEEEKGLILV